MIYLQFRALDHKYIARGTYIIIRIFIIYIRGKLFAQNPQLTLDVSRLSENFVHVIVLLWQPLRYVHRSKQKTEDSTEALD